MKKYFKLLSTALLAGALVLTGCNFNPGENGNGGYNGSAGWDNGVMRIHFNLSDAKALASQEKGSESRYASSARVSDETKGLLVKILDDGSLASVIEFPDDVNPDDFVITQIAVSPAQNADELYIVVNNGYGSYGIGGLLCVKSDGSYFDILTDLRNSLENSSSFDLYGNNSDNDYIKFDKLGNMYFQTRTWQNNRDTTMIYKYNPKKNEATPLTPAVSGTYYEDYIVSDNGAWIFASASRWINNKTTRYLRAIPTANAEQYVNITYSSDGNGWYRNMIYDDENGYLYFNGWVKNSSGIYRIQKKNGTFDTKDLKCMTNNSGSGGWFSFWNLVESKYQNINLGNLLQWKNSSERKIEPALMKQIKVWDENFTLVDGEGNFHSENLIKAFEKELNSITIGGATFTTNINDVGSSIKICFSFDLFENIPGYEKLASVAKGKTNAAALEALNTKETLCLLYKLFNNTYWSDHERYSYDNSISSTAYKHNFMADITYLVDNKGDKTGLVCNAGPEYFNMNNTDYEKYYSCNGCVQYIYPLEESWYQNMEWNSDYMNGSEPNYEAILNKLKEYCEPGDIEFNLKAFKDDPNYSGLYTEQTDIEALKYITESNNIGLLQDWLYYGDDSQKTTFLKKTCFFKGTDVSACTLDGGSTYKWRDEYLMEDGSPNCEVILNKFYSYCVDGEKEFNLKNFQTISGFTDLYTDKVDEEAIEFLSTSDKLRLMNDYANTNTYSGEEGGKKIIRNTCFKKGTDETAYNEDSSSGSYISWEFSNLKAMAKTSKGIFGSVPGYQWNNGNSQYYNAFMKLFDENGLFQMYTIPDSLKYYATEIQVAGDIMVFKNAVMNENGDETGSHTIQAFDASTSTFKDLFEKVDGANIEILSYSVGGGYVYFCGVQGLSLISGKIDMETKAYTPINSSKKMNQIITVTQ